MIDSRLLQQLKQIVGTGFVSSGRADAEVYAYDGSLATGAPGAVVLPADAEQIAAVIRAAAEANVSYVPRGFGTNLSGGSIALDGGLIIGLTRLNRILDIRTEGRYAVVQPGVTNLELQQALDPLGFFYAPDPASQKVATLGGNVAENSGGPHCLKYGVTTNHVLGMTCILPSGELVRLGGPALDPPGYDLRGVLIASEGTLGVVTEVVVRILPLPESVVTMLVVYDDIADAARSVSAIIAAGIVPATLEMMDQSIIRAVEESKPCGYPLDAAAVLIAEVDGPIVGLKEQAERIGRLCLENGCREVRTAKDEAERSLLWAGRRGAFGAIARLSPSFFVADCTVPRTRLPEALAHVAEIALAHDLEYANVFHAGDGNLHPLLLFDSRNSEQVRRVHKAGELIMKACVALGGTITGEHGIGTEKSDAMRLICSEDDLEFQRALRTAFDPADLLNPGKIFPPRAEAEAPTQPTDGPYRDKAELVPADVDDACAMVQSAYRDKVPLLPLGAATRPDFGNRSDCTFVRLRSTSLSDVVEYDPANQTIAVGAGMSVIGLQEVLAERKQWLPIRPPLGNNGTVGGLAATAACGPERLRYGGPRDLMLGLKFVSGTGRLITAGGRVVKNVAGYDVTRLLVGSAGTLGLLTELTFRVASLPECRRAFSAVGALEACQVAARELLCSKLEPTWVVAA
ncbi:MAG: FAD-linked oxidase C-terminal domain-containing protein, partial [Pirellulaceae bacterium]